MDFEKQLQRLKVLSGIYKPYLPEETQQENISYTGTEKSKLQKKAQYTTWHRRMV